ncbi:MAG: hypothetical protein JXR96_14155 [Deltaproteobacteria bacterium]|nr:hypothetical protein [Deltaproteobacteria bacterium]
MNDGMQPVPMPGQPLGALPSSPKVLGTLSIIFASIWMLLNMFSACAGLAGSAVGKLGGLAAMEGGRDAQIAGEALETIATVYRIMGIQGLLMLGMSAVLLAVGIGQLRYRRWAADWSVYWGVGALVVLAIVACLYIFVVGPAYERLFESIGQHDAEAAQVTEMMSGMGSMMGGGTAIATIVFLAPYPILLIAFFRKQRVRAAMTT